VRLQHGTPVPAGRQSRRAARLIERLHPTDRARDPNPENSRRLVPRAIDAYKARLPAGNTTEKLVADLAARELAAEQRELPDLHREMRRRKVLGLGSTDPLTGSLDTSAGWLMALWFGGRSAEKVARIIARR
jgi:hypothetical protein